MLSSTSLQANGSSECSGIYLLNDNVLCTYCDPGNVLIKVNENNIILQIFLNRYNTSDNILKTKQNKTWGRSQ